MARPKRFTTGYKLLVASVGVASITYSSCKGPVANLMACPQDQCGGSAGSTGSSTSSTGGSGGSGGSATTSGTGATASTSGTGG